MPGSTTATAQPRPNILEGKIIAESGAQLDQREARSVLALAAKRTVAVTIIDVSERGGFELGVFHPLERIADRSRAHPQY